MIGLLISALMTIAHCDLNHGLSMFDKVGADFVGVIDVDWHAKRSGSVAQAEAQAEKYGYVSSYTTDHFIYETPDEQQRMEHESGSCVDGQVAACGLALAGAKVADLTSRKVFRVCGTRDVKVFPFCSLDSCLPAMLQGRNRYERFCNYRTYLADNCPEWAAQNIFHEIDGSGHDSIFAHTEKPFLEYVQGGF